MLVVREWGPAMRLPEPWRLEKRLPGVTADRRAAALAEAHVVRRRAYELTAEAWPHDGREDVDDVQRVSEPAAAPLMSRYPQLDPRSLRRAVNQANYTHAK